MFAPREDAEKPPEHSGDGLCLLRRKLHDWGLLSDESFKFGDNVDHECPFGPRLAQRVAPAGQLGVALARSADQGLNACAKIA